MSGKELDEKQKKEKQAMFQAMGVVGKLHNIFIHSQSSAVRAAEFERVVGRMIPLDNCMRWNSWLQLLEAALKVESKIHQYVDMSLDLLKKDILSPQNWASLRTIYNFLKPLHRATLQTQGDSARLDKVLLTMDILLICTE